MFFITVSNGLLETKHRKKIGSAVWEFMWLIDKVTKIDDEGFGWVLGGKPINLKDIKGIHPVNVSKNLKKLEDAGYIFITHTPYGLSIRVAKAKKSFSKKTKPQGLAKTLNHATISLSPISDNAKPNIGQDHYDNINKTNQYNTIFSEKDRKELISLFEPLNPNFEVLFSRKNQTEALRRMVEKFGRIKTENSIKAAASVAGKKYAPSITTPLQLEEKLGQLINYFKREKERGSMLVKI